MEVEKEPCSGDCKSLGFFGSGFTEYKCKECSSIEAWPNTGTPALCPSCALKLNKCAHCMKDKEKKQ